MSAIAQGREVVLVVALQSSRYSQQGSAGLAGDSAASDVDEHVERLLGVDGLERRQDGRAVLLSQEVLIQLSLIDDDSFLKAIKTIIESKVNESVYKLSDFQKNRIESGRKQLKKGQSISNDTLQKEIDQWLNTK